jgi:hypothetical protein
MGITVSKKKKTKSTEINIIKRDHILQLEKEKGLFHVGASSL